VTTITAVAGVRDTDSGIASATLNVGQQIGGSIGLAALAAVVLARAAINVKRPEAQPPRD
jgi:hypothetical protein